jgi:tape measure domain-containing protein
VLNLGGLFFTLDADTRGLMNAQRRVERFANDVRAAFRGVGRGTVSPEFANGLARQERAMIAAMERIKRVQNQVANANLTPRGAREAQVTLERLTGVYDNFTRKLASGVNLNTLDFGRRVQHMNAAITDATRNIQNLQREAKQGTNILHGFGSAALLVQGHLGGVSTRVFALTTLVKDFGVTAAVATGIFAGLAAGIGVLGTQSIKAGMDLQQVEKIFGAVSGNALVAQYHIGFVKDVAAQAGLVFQDTAKGFARFLISAQSAGLSLGVTQQAFRDIALSAATMQLSVEDTQGVFRALDQMMSKGTVQAEELRGQLGDRLPGAFVVAASAMGKTTAELNKMLKAGDVVAAEFVPKFAAAYSKMLGIDPSAPIQTLRAELARSANEWTYFLQAFENATNGTGILAGAVSSLGNVLRFLAENMTQVLGAVGALTGAMIALGIAMAAPAILAWARNVGIWITLSIEAARAVGILSAATQLLNVVMGSNIIVRLISLLTTLALMIGGAILGYNLLTSAIESNNNGMSGSVKFMQQYITQQKAMGVQIRSVTQDMINQANVQLKLAQSTAAKAAGDANRIAINGPSLWERLSTPGGALPGGAARIQQNALKEAQEAGKAYQEMLGIVGGLNDVSKLPEAGGTSAFKGMEDAAKGAKESVEGVTNRIKDLIDASAIANRQLNAMMQPLQQGEDITQRMNDLADLGEAMRMVNNLSSKELGTAAGLLGVGANIEDVTGAVKNLIGETRRAEEAVRGFVGVMGEIQGGEREMKALGRQMEYIKSIGFGIADPNQMRYLDELGRAEDTLHQLASSGSEGMKALQSIVNYLQQAGVAGSNAAEMLANFNVQLANQRDQVRFLEDHLRKMKELRTEIQDTMNITSAFEGNGGIMGQMFGADIGDAFERATDRGRQIAQLATQMHALGFSQADINTQTERYLNLLRELDASSYSYDRAKEASERTRDVWRSFISEGLSGIHDLISGVDSLTDVLVNMAKSFMDIGWQNFVVAPLEGLMQNMGRKKGEGAAGGIDSNIVNQVTNALFGLGEASKGTSDTMGGSLAQSISGLITQQVTQQMGTQATTAALGALAVSAGAAATALAAIAASAGGGGGGGEGGEEMGIFGSLLRIGLTAFAGGASAGPSSAAIASGNFVGPRAMGGNMAAGSIYSVNETGVRGEYFIPRVSGYMSPNAPGAGGGMTMIDASTTVDARGATMETVAELKAELRARDRRLRAELPYLVDNRTRDNVQRLRNGR